MKDMFDVEALLREASAQCGGLRDFGDPHFMPALQATVAALASEARLSPAGAPMMRGRLVELLRNRLKIEDYCRHHPEILDEVIVQPVVIVGLPRTGTTLLQRLLAADRRFYSLAWWESRHPVPIAPLRPDGIDPRIPMARVEVDAMIGAMPDLLAIHPLAAEEADEEVMLMEHSFHGALDAYAHIPSYVQWREQQDQVPAYAYLKKLLQFVQWQKKRRGVTAERWLLKAPHHLYAMQALFSVFPDARIIQTHRDPLQTVPSIASFIHTLWRMYSDEADKAAAGRQWSGQFARGMQRTMEFRDGREDAFHDIRFIDTVKRPMDVVQDVYRFLGMQVTHEAEQAMRAWMAANQRENRAAHAYTAAEFGLSEEQLKHDYAAYRARYIEPETT